MQLVQLLVQLFHDSGIEKTQVGDIVMMGVGCLLVWLGVAKNFEPLLLVCIGFGVILVNVPGAEEVMLAAPQGETPGGLYWYVSHGIEWEIFPPLIFLGVGALTDFSPLIASPYTFLLGAAAQFGIFFTFVVARLLFGYTDAESGSIAIIGGADGPTSIYTCMHLAPKLLPAIAVSGYSYMALVPLIQPPIMRLLTTKKERAVVMKELRPVSKTERVMFPIVVMIVVNTLVPMTTPLVGMLMLGNLLRETGVTERLSKAAQNEIINMVTIFLGTAVGMMAKADNFLTWKTIGIFCLGIVAFASATAGGILLGKLMCWITRGKVNPLIGSAGVSAVPMAARVSQVVGQEENPNNYLLMHAMGPNVAGVIGTAIAAGVLLTMFGK